LVAGAVKLKRTALNYWVRFEAPALSRRGTLTLSSGMFQSLKGSMLDLATRRAAELLVAPLTLADVETTGSAMINIGTASMENGSTLTLVNTSELRQAAAVFNQLPFEQTAAADLALSDDLASAGVPNSISTVASSESGTPVTGQAVVPVPEPSVVALSALSVTGLLTRRRRR
jgi:hypothetical protein